MELIKKITAFPDGEGKCVITVVTDDITFTEKTADAFAKSTVENYENCETKDELYTHMLYVRLFDEYDRRCQKIISNSKTMMAALRDFAYEVSTMQDILYVLEENNVPTDRALELLNLPGDLMEAIFLTLEGKDESAEMECIMDEIVCDFKINRIAQNGVDRV